MIKKWIRDTRMGFIPSQAGIMRRMLREEGGWQSHLEKTCDFIQQAVKEQTPKSIRILGSGWLLDIPMKYLIDHCERIVLTDISHPNQIINRYSVFKSVEFETVDLTGGIVNLSYNLKKKSFSFDNFLHQIESSTSMSFGEDLIVSVNLLSQLSVILTDYLTKKLNLSTSQVASIAEAIQKKHLEMLPLGKSLLIADYEEEYYDEENKLIGSKPTIYTTLPKGNGNKEWIWNFDSKMMYKEDCKTIQRVMAIRL